MRTRTLQLAGVLGLVAIVVIALRSSATANANAAQETVELTPAVAACNCEDGRCSTCQCAGAGDVTCECEACLCDSPLDATTACCAEKACCSEVACSTDGPCCTGSETEIAPGEISLEVDLTLPTNGSTDEESTADAVAEQTVAEASKDASSDAAANEAGDPDPPVQSADDAQDKAA